eukprot:TRINITY_DN782230_c0_g1_i1.p1 TRINITY_DN782230_c0_g1~~TRINITY_DN782230_c0_g1_i1.p1  ORF type:complete len:362 (-),score=98.20 TRINITY_DN782230_c0_g1_i1:80-1165(-)
MADWLSVSRGQKHVPKGSPPSMGSSKPDAPQSIHTRAVESETPQDPDKARSAKHFNLVKISEYLMKQRKPDGLHRYVKFTELENHFKFDVNLELVQMMDKTHHEVGEDSIRYRPKVEATSKNDILRTLTTQKKGLDFKDLKDSYTNIESDVADAIRKGECIAVRVAHSEKRPVLFDRKFRWYVEMGEVSVSMDSRRILTEQDFSKQVHRGDFIQLGTKYPFRVSREEDKKTRKTNLKPLQTIQSYSVASDQGFQNANWSQPFDQKEVPLDKPYTGESRCAVLAIRQGVTNDIRKEFAECVKKASSVIKRQMTPTLNKGIEPSSKKPRKNPNDNVRKQRGKVTNTHMGMQIGSLPSSGNIRH